MKESRAWVSRVGLGLILLISAAVVSGCGGGSLPSEMKEQSGGTKGDGNGVHKGQSTSGTPAPAAAQ